MRRSSKLAREDWFGIDASGPNRRERCTRIRLYCSAYHSESAFYPLARHLERASGLLRTDAPEERLRKLDQTLCEFTNQVDEAVALLGPLLSMPVSDRHLQLDYTPQRRKQRTLEVMIEQLDGIASHRPLFIVLEDAHWIDPSSLDVFDLLIEQIQVLRVLLLITFRPEFSCPWKGHGHITHLSLSRLGQRHVTAIVESLTGGRSLPGEVLSEILRKTDGIPLFIEELTKSILESGLLVDERNRYELRSPSLPALAIPETLHDSLIARLDRLGEIKEIAQTAAVIGREFSRDLLATVIDLDDQRLTDALKRMTDAELIFRRGAAEPARYLFKHALIEDAAYQSLLRIKRQDLHTRIAEALERHFPETADRQPEVLAHHYTEGEQFEVGLDFWERAGQLATKRSAGKEAATHFSRGLETLQTLPETTHRKQREISLQNQLAGVLVNVAGLASEELEQAYIRARELCEQIGDRRQEFIVEWGLWHVYLGRAEFGHARELANHLLGTEGKFRGPVEELQAYHADWSTLGFEGRANQMNRRCEQGWELYDRDIHAEQAFIFGGHDPGVCSRNMGAWALWRLGYADKAHDCFEQGLSLARAIGHPQIVAHASNWGMLLYQFRRDTAVVDRLATAALDLASEQALANYYTDATIIQGWLLMENDQPREASRIMKAALAERQNRGTLFLQPFYLSLLAQAYLMQDRETEALAILTEAMDCADRSGECWLDAELARLRGQVLVRLGQREEAVTCFENSIRTATSHESRAFELRAATSLARLWADQGERSKARDLLQPVYDWFIEGFDTGDLKDARVVLEQVCT